MILGAVLLAGGAVHAASYRDAVSVPPVEVFRSMIRYSDANQMDKITGSLIVLAPILNHIKEKFKNDPRSDIENAIGTGDSAKVLRSVQALVVWDIKDLLEESLLQVQTSVDQGKTSIKIARMEYEILSPAVQKRNFSSDQVIKKAFMNLYQTISSDVYSGQSSAPNIARAQESLIQIGLILGKEFLDLG